MTLTDAMSSAVPPGPLAVSVYLVVELGYTCRLPDDCTVPMLGVIVTLVALATDHLNVEDCPRSIDAGTALNTEMTGFGGGGALSFVTGGGGGGGADATFFLQAAAKSRKQNPTASNVTFRLVI